MAQGEHEVTYRKDYKPPVFTIDKTNLDFDIQDNLTRVRSSLAIRRNTPGPAALRLHGEHLVLKAVAIDGRELTNNEYSVDAASLTLLEVPDECEISITTEICPEENTALEGLYKSSGMYCTQCEAEGFRNITYYLDQPDVLSEFTTSIVADDGRYPTLLANGNKIADERTADGRRRVVWHDPFPKPSYLFALVAGDLAMLEDSFVTASGRTVALQIFSEPHNIGQCDYAMDALKRSMRWDEEVYGREYDLDVFMVVAVEDFNMGAMENKGLNIFNTSCVLATPDTATDAGFQRVEAVVAHEYFHNWSGNRVTCRDWFQLSLKEGFTVFRDAQFSSDMNAATVKRIEDVVRLRAVQFAEDAGPMAHSIRPDSYIQIDNFYTTTVYEKGAEVVRMLHTLLGADGFRRGSDLYFDRHDGQAATTEDFVQAMEDANDVKLHEFRAWYAQAGTPRVHLSQSRSGDALELQISQSCPPTPGQPVKEPFHIPLVLGLVDETGRELSPSDMQLDTQAKVTNRNGGVLLELTQPETQLRIQPVPEGAVVSALRDFSAPVALTSDRSDAELAHLVAHDSDGFSRWDAIQTLFANEITRLAENPDAQPDASLTELVGKLLEQAVASARDAAAGEGQALLKELLTLPAEADLFERFRPVDVQAVLGARQRLAEHLAATHIARWQQLYEAATNPEPYSPTAAAIARRGLRNLALAEVARGSGASNRPEAMLQQHFEAADNLTDRRAALAVLMDVAGFADAFVDTLFASFYERWKHEALVVDTWLNLQAAGPLAGALERVVQLEAHSAFDERNPNKVRALYAGFAMQNHTNFHAPDGSGYDFLVRRIERLNATNPQLAARLTGPLTQWQRYTRDRQLQMRAALESVLAIDALSPNVFELASKSLSDE